MCGTGQSDQRSWTSAAAAAGQPIVVQARYPLPHVFGLGRSDGLVGGEVKVPSAGRFQDVFLQLRLHDAEEGEERDSEIGIQRGFN